MSSLIGFRARGEHEPVSGRAPKSGLTLSPTSVTQAAASQAAPPISRQPQTARSGQRPTTAPSGSARTACRRRLASSLRTGDIRNEATDKDFVSTGCAIVFLNYLIHQKGVPLEKIVANQSPTVAGVDLNLTGENDSFAVFKTLLDRRLPTSSAVSLVSENPLRSFERPPGKLLRPALDQCDRAGVGVDGNEACLPERAARAHALLGLHTGRSSLGSEASSWRSGLGSDGIHCRAGMGRTTWSNRSAAACAVRRVPHDGRTRADPGRMYGSAAQCSTTRCPGQSRPITRRHCASAAARAAGSFRPARASSSSCIMTRSTRAGWPGSIRAPPCSCAASWRPSATSRYRASARSPAGCGASAST